MMNRRQFLSAGAAAALGYAAAPLIVTARTTPYRTALIGTGWWGMNILRTALEAGQSQVTGLCDVDRNQLDPAAENIRQLTGSKPRTYGDFRELLHREKPEIVVVATPDHWHALNALAAMESGAHVYLEKPIGHTINEGKALVASARLHDRIVQVGTHRRASPHNQSAMAFLRSGKLGRIGMVRAFVHYPGGPGEPTPDAEPPEGLDWDFWCGPAPLRPFNPRIHPRGFRNFLEYANGTLGDWGIHWLDQILWWSEEQYPKTVFSTGARHIRRDSTNAPDTQVASFAFENFTAVWEHRLYAGNAAEKHNIGCYFYGTEGTLHLGWQDGWTFYPTAKGASTVHEEPRLDKPDDQNIRALWDDFLASIRTGRPPMCDIEKGHRATTMSLLGMLSLKVGRSLAWDGEKERIVGDEEAGRLLSRPYRAPWVYPD